MTKKFLTRFGTLIALPVALTVSFSSFAWAGQTSCPEIKSPTVKVIKVKIIRGNEYFWKWFQLPANNYVLAPSTPVTTPINTPAKNPDLTIPTPAPAPALTPSPTVTPSTGTAPAGITNPVEGLTADEQKMFDLVNKERIANGLKPLQIDMRLVKIARMKSQDMIANNYFSHQSPTYGSPFDMMKSNGISYLYAGENLAGAPTVDMAHTNLMNSPGHRANILNANYTAIGIGIIDGGPYGKMFTQEFIGN